MGDPPPAYDFGLNARLAVSLERIGSAGEPVVVIDDVLRDPEALVEYAAREVAFAPAWSARGGYPGLRAPAPLDYVDLLVRSLAPVLEKAFQLERVKLARAECNLSLVTLEPGQLAPLQRVPHIDTVDPLQFAFLHFLCGEGFGGTAFYRHRASGYETLTQANIQAFEAVRERELAGDPPEAAYIGGDTAAYQRTGGVEARFNHVLIYRSRLLHSGHIPDAALLSADPRRGRLTANVFVNYRPE